MPFWLVAIRAGTLTGHIFSRDILPLFTGGLTIMHIRIAVALIASLLASSARADETFLSCKLSVTVDEKGVRSAITGTDVFVIGPQPDGSTTYTVPAGCRTNTLTAKVSDTELMFECEHAVAEGFRYIMTINRVMIPSSPCWQAIRRSVSPSASISSDSRMASSPPGGTKPSSRWRRAESSVPVRTRPSK